MKNLIKLANYLDDNGHIKLANKIDQIIIKKANAPILWKCRGDCKREILSANQPPDCCGKPMEHKDCSHCGKSLRESLRTEDKQYKSCPMCSARKGRHIFYGQDNYTMSGSRARIGEDLGFPTNCDGCNWNQDLHGKPKNLPPVDIDCKLVKGRGQTQPTKPAGVSKKDFDRMQRLYWVLEINSINKKQKEQGLPILTEDEVKIKSGPVSAETIISRVGR